MLTVARGLSRDGFEIRSLGRFRYTIDLRE